MPATKDLRNQANNSFLGAELGGKGGQGPVTGNSLPLGRHRVSFLPGAPDGAKKTGPFLSPRFTASNSASYRRVRKLATQMTGRGVLGRLRHLAGRLVYVE